MAYDATKMADWQISEAAEAQMKSVWQLQDEIGLTKDEIIPYGRIGRVNFAGNNGTASGQTQRQIYRSNGHYSDPSRRRKNNNIDGPV